MADMYLVSHSDMVGVADEIRAKSGKTDSLTFPNGWKEAISSMTTEEIINHADIPDYVKSEALEVAKRVQAVRKSDSIVFLGMSDNHHYGRQGEAGVDTSVDPNGTQNNKSNLHAMMASKILSYALNLDFIAHLGDGTWGHTTTTSALLQEQHGELYSWLSETEKGIPTFRAIGNHDTGTYYHKAMNESGKTGIYTENPEYLYDTFTGKSDSENTVFGNSSYGDYCYRDFEDKKLRVFLLNTSEGILYKALNNINKSVPPCLGSQLIWFADALLNLNEKPNASQWKIVVLSHYPADYGSTMPLSDVIRAYVEGQSITISHENGTKDEKDFSGKNAAKFVAQFHGHIHNFLYTKLSTGTTANNVLKYDAWRVSIPNAQYDRENYYDEKNTENWTTETPYFYIPLKDDETYGKTPNTAEDVSFVVNVINPSEEVIHSICYGAGVDRLISYGATQYYRVIYNIIGFESSENVGSVEENTPYSTVLTKASDEHEVKELKVTMGGVDVTDLYYSNGVLNIPTVTGDIVITAKAKLRENFTDLIPTSEAFDSTEPYNKEETPGYNDNTYVSSSSGADGNKSGYYATGLIRATKGDVIRLEDVGFVNGDEYSRIVLFNANKEKITNSVWDGTNFGTSAGFNAVFDDNGYLVEFTLGHSYCDNMTFFRIGGQHICDESVITKNEEISYGTPTYATYAVTYSLSNVTSSSAVKSIQQGNTYSTTLTVEEGYELNSVVVTMGGVDVTSTVYSNGIVTISNVTGDIVITAVASALANENLNYYPHTSVDENGEPYNGKGYQENTYLSSGVAKNKNGVTTTGFMEAYEGDIVYLENIILRADDGNSRIAHYDINKSHISTATPSAFTHNGTTVIFDDNGNLVNFRIGKAGCAFIRICTSSGITNKSAIGINERIEVPQ